MNAAFDPVKLKPISRKTGPMVALLLLIGAGILMHSIALARVEMIGTLSNGLTRGAAGRVQFIEYISAYPFVLMPYIAVFVGSILWMQFRKLPRWSLWLTFTFLALPVFGYMWICLRLTRDLAA